MSDATRILLKSPVGHGRNLSLPLQMGEDAFRAWPGQVVRRRESKVVCTAFSTTIAALGVCLRKQSGGIEAWQCKASLLSLGAPEVEAQSCPLLRSGWHDTSRLVVACITARTLHALCLKSTGRSGQQAAAARNVRSEELSCIDMVPYRS